MINHLGFVAAAIWLTACGGDSGSMNQAPSLLGSWATQASGVALRATFSGEETGGSAKLSQVLSTDAANCQTSLFADGKFTASNSSITITVTSAHQTTTAGCGAVTDTPITDLTPLQNFAGALSGPYVLTETTLKLGNAYPTFDRAP